MRISVPPITVMEIQVHYLSHDCVDVIATVDNNCVIVGPLNARERADLAKHLREVADELCPLTDGANS